jgi:Mrp family chromosome partitioning ATPase
LEANEKSCESCNDASCPAHDHQSGEKTEDFLERQAIARRMCRVRHKILVVSGKGGVGKSTIAVNLAATLARAGKSVGLMDVDVHGPSVPRLLGLVGRQLEAEDDCILPFAYKDNLKAISIGFLLESADDAIIWRGPMKFALIKQFLRDVKWGDLDFLIVDSPPGTGDEPISVAQLIPEADGAVMVTTPQALATADVRRCIGFCRQVGLPVIGVVENMAGMVCPECGKTVDLFGSGGGEQMAREMGVPFLGSVPIDPKMVELSDEGTPYMEAVRDTETASAFAQIVEPILALDSDGAKD